MSFLIEVVIFDYFKGNNAVIRSHYGIMIYMKLFELVRAGALRLERGEAHQGTRENIIEILRETCSRRQGPRSHRSSDHELIPTLSVTLSPPLFLTFVERRHLTQASYPIPFDPQYPFPLFHRTRHPRCWIAPSFSLVFIFFAWRRLKLSFLFLYKVSTERVAYSFALLVSRVTPSL